MAEHVCLDFKKEFNLPVVIFRPSIVSVSETDPIMGWCANLNGPMGLIFVTALAINHVVMHKSSNWLDMIPVDICIKGMIIAAWKQWKDQKTSVESMWVLKIFTA